MGTDIDPEVGSLGQGHGVLNLNQSQQLPYLTVLRTMWLISTTRIRFDLASPF